MLTSILPFAIIISFNVAIIIALRKRKGQVSEYHGNQSDKNNAVAILISVSLTFIIITLPYALYILLQSYYSSVGKYRLLERTSIILGTMAPICDSLNHSINISIASVVGSLSDVCWKWFAMPVARGARESVVLWRMRESLTRTHASQSSPVTPQRSTEG